MLHICGHSSTENSLMEFKSTVENIEYPRSENQHKNLVEEENAEMLRFPKEFETKETRPLINSEVFLLLKLRKELNLDTNSLRGENNPPENNYFQKSLNYTKRFLKFESEKTIREVRSILHAVQWKMTDNREAPNKEQKSASNIDVSNTCLHKFEIAAIANLCPQTAEEARSLIPTLDRADKPNIYELSLILEKINTKQKFVF